MDIQWYIQRGSQTFGPYTWQQLWWMSRQGRLGPADLVWHAGMAGWIPIGQLPGIGQEAPADKPGGRRRSSKGLVASLVVLVILVVVTGTAALDRQQRPDPARPATTVRTTAGQQTGRTTRTTTTTTTARETEVTMPRSVPAPPGARLAASNRLYGYYQFHIPKDTRIDTYCSTYQDMIREAGYKIVPVWPCQEDAAYFYIQDGHDHVASVEMQKGTVDVVFSGS